jgi:hypothetical protein
MNRMIAEPKQFFFFLFRILVAVSLKTIKILKCMKNFEKNP